MARVIDACLPAVLPFVLHHPLRPVDAVRVKKVAWDTLPQRWGGGRCMWVSGLISDETPSGLEL